MSKEPRISPADKLLLIGLIIFGIAFIIDHAVKEKKAQEKQRQEEQAKAWAEQERERAKQQEVEYWEENYKTPEQIEAEKRALSEEVQQLLNSGRGLYGKGATPSRAIGTSKPIKSNLPQRGTAFGDGYWDGYEEGFDDADGHNTYGFKYDETTKKYTGNALAEYVRGYRKGYKEGWDEGIEQLQDRFENGDDEL